MLTDPDTSIAGRIPGLPDDAFDHDGLVTKRLVRATALAQLRPKPGETLWDIGAGAGSVAVEWCRTAPTNRALAVEKKPARATRCAGNFERLTLPDQTMLVIDDAVTAITSWTTAGHTPDAVFIGGGASDTTITRSWQALRSGGRLVVHGVTVETELLCLAAHGTHGGELTRISLEHGDTIGTMRGWKPARTIVSWTGTKP